MNFLKNHPFPVQAHFEKSTVLTFAVPKEELLGFIPECLSLDTFNDKWAFIAVAMVQTKGLRPKGFHKFFGRDFFLIGFRIFVRYKNKKGKSLRGLYIIRSQTNSMLMKFFGNIFTHYNYTATDIQDKLVDGVRTISSSQSNFEVCIDASSNEAGMPEESPFVEWKDARKFSGPLPHTFTHDSQRKEVLIILGVRKNWKPKPIAVSQYSFQFLDELNLKDVRLASAFEVTDVPYHWEKGKVESWD